MLLTSAASPWPAEGTWALDRELRGQVWFTLDDGVGRPSRWVTLRALRVLRWWDREAS